jgi:predicted transcriptional regulator of viral defense system
MTRSSRETVRALFFIALEQGGHFTAQQAEHAGYGYPHLDYHVATGSFERAPHGLYRLTSVPPGKHDHLVRLILWSHNDQDEPQAVVSHESALDVHDLPNLLPQAIHLTVPPGFRKEPPAGCVLHKATLAPAEIEERAELRVTTPVRTLLDVAARGVPLDELEKAVLAALSRGLVSWRKLTEAAQKNLRSARLLRIFDDLPEPAA